VLRNIFRRKPKAEHVAHPNGLQWLGVDIHNHILPGIDDGSPDVDSSLEMLRKYEYLGIKKIIATPHIKSEQFFNTRESIREAYDILMPHVRENNINVEVLISAEYYIDEHFLTLLNNDELMPLPGNYLLLEVSIGRKSFLDLKHIGETLIKKGYFPILAHPERYLYWQKNLTYFEELKASGWLLQINLLSLAGYYGEIERRTGEKLIEADLVDFVGTDCHRTTHLEILEDNCDELYSKLSNKYLLNKFL